MIDPSLLAATIPTLRTLPAAAIQRLASAAEDRAVRARGFIFRAGERPAAIHFVLAGRVRVVHESEGRVRVVHWEGPGGTLGEVPTFGDVAYPVTAVARTAVRLARLRSETVRRLAAEDSAIAAYFLGRLAKRAAGLLDQLDRLRGETVTARLARFLLDRSREAADGPFALGMSQAALAEELGTVREVLVRSLAALKRSGALVQPQRGRYAIADRAACRAMLGLTTRGRGTPRDGRG